MLDKVARHIKEKAPAVETLRPEAPPAVSHIVKRLLAKKPPERFQTPAELISALEPLAVDAPPPWLAEPSDGTGLGATTEQYTEFPELEAHLARVAQTRTASVLTPEQEIELPATTSGRWRSFVKLIIAAAVLGSIAAYSSVCFVK